MYFVLFLRYNISPLFGVSPPLFSVLSTLVYNRPSPYRCQYFLFGYSILLRLEPPPNQTIFLPYSFIHFCRDVIFPCYSYRVHYLTFFQLNFYQDSETLHCLSLFEIFLRLQTYIFIVISDLFKPIFSRFYALFAPIFFPFFTIFSHLFCVSAHVIVTFSSWRLSASFSLLF